MTRLTLEQREIITILIAVADGDTNEEQCARVEQLVRDDEDMQLFVLQLLNQEAWLSLHGLHETSTSVRAELAAKIRELLTADEACEVSQALAEQRAMEDLFVHRSIAQQLPRKSVVGRWMGSVSLHSAPGWVVPAIYAVLLVGIGMAVGTWVNPVAENASGGAPGVGVAGVVAAPASCQAQLVQYTSCVWGPEMRPRASDSLRGGDSLNLIYGLADLVLGWPDRGNAKVRLEGPAGMVLMADGGVNLNYGKLTANVALDDERFAVETPLGRVEVTNNATIGVTVSPKSIELHVFSGEAKIVTSWASDSVWSDTLEVRADQSIQLATTDAGTVKIKRSTAAPGFFVTQVSMTDDLLEVSKDYVAAIKAAAPVCYWRFNRPADGVIRNEMADCYHGQVFGPTEWVEEHDNWTIQCGGWLVTDKIPSHVVADRPLKSVGIQSYSLEVWAKPSHFHLGTIAALVGPNPDGSSLHGMLLELGGPWSIYTGREHPGRVRYLHRNPPDVWGGTSCFSNVAYGLRKWQHIVAVKNNSDMRLYIDGQEVVKYGDTTPLPDGLRLLVGQLDRERNERVFIGQLDELAFYERALSEEEIRQHFRLVRPDKMAPGEI